jgi:hypothetical protein
MIGKGDKVCLTVEIYFTACKRSGCKRQIRLGSRRESKFGDRAFSSLLPCPCRMDMGQRYMDAQVILKSVDSLNHSQPQHLAIKSIPIHFNTSCKTTQTVWHKPSGTNRLRAHQVLLIWRTGCATGKELFVPQVTIERGVWGSYSGQADVRSEPHDCFMRLFVYCSPLLASILIPDKSQSHGRSAS